MVVATTKYGTMATHTGTLAEVMGVIGSYRPSDIVAFVYNSTSSIYVAVTKLMH